MNEGYKHIIYTAEDIHRYFSGNLSPAEMHEMERAALQDPFLAEAMEGYEGMHGQDVDKYLSPLKEKFTTGKESTKVIPIHGSRSYKWLKLSAAVLVTAISISIIYLFNNKKNAVGEKQTVVAAIKQIDTSKTVVNAGNPGTLSSVTKNHETVIASPGNPTREKINILPDNRWAMADSSFVYRPGKKDDGFAQVNTGSYTTELQRNNTEIPAGNDSRVNNVSPASNLVTNNTQNSALAENETAKDIQRSVKMEKKSNADLALFDKAEQAPTNKVFTATIVSPQGFPLPFANINIRKENRYTYADVKGNFKALSFDSLLNVEVKVVGYASQSYTLRSDIAQNKIVLQENLLALRDRRQNSGKAAKFLSKEKKATEPQTDADFEAEPVDGWDNYDLYLMNNIRLPVYTLNNNIYGEVEVQFEVRNNGALSNFKISKSLCEDCDKEAIRIIKEGPQWKVNKGSSATASIKVQF